MTTKQLEQIFNDNSDCYADTWEDSGGEMHNGCHMMREGESISAMTLPKFIEVVGKLLANESEVWNDKDDNIEVPDLTELTEIEKEEFINGFGQTAVEGFMRIFYAFKLNTHIDYSCVEDNTGDKFTLQFRKTN